MYTILSFSIVYGVWHIKEGSGGSSYIAQMACNRIATVWAMQMGGSNEGMSDSCTHTNK